MEDSRDPKGFLYVGLASGSRPTSRPTRRFKAVCKRDLKNCGIQPAGLKVEVSNRTSWRAKVKKSIKSTEEKRESEREEKRTSPSPLLTPPTSLTSPAASVNNRII
ncbi:hypothetical protein RRG08_057983 [Elysia crispata]|uniref:Uncharacterized protein n=1 Tax=Elysia crispata TaxID=231223 RepID=A0AAE1DXV0_9GAST|nr:hypothetical protein RRG08_057983 [Elysia crispata]